MQDILWIAVTIAFFVAAIGYVRFCDYLKWGWYACRIRNHAHRKCSHNGIPVLRAAPAGKVL